MKNKILLFATMLILVSCSNPSLDKMYDKAQYETDAVELKKSLSEADYEMLSGYISAASGDAQMTGKTYGDILVEVKKANAELKQKEDEAKQLAEKEKLAAAEKVKKMTSVLSASLVDKDFVNFNSKAYLTYRFAIENKTDKDISGFSGVVIFTDLTDKQINSLNISYNDGIPAKATKNWNAQAEYNSSLDSDVALKDLTIENLKVKLLPLKIMFSDNSTLE